MEFWGLKLLPVEFWAFSMESLHELCGIRTPLVESGASQRARTQNSPPQTRILGCPQSQPRHPNMNFGGVPQVPQPSSW